MKRNLVKTLYLLTALSLAFAFIACGGGGGGSDAVTYSGSTDPAVADSTTAAALAEYTMGIVKAGSPLAQVFIAPPGGVLPVALATPLIVSHFTSVTLAVPGEGILYGNDYSSAGTGTADINGSLTLFLSNTISDVANTWDVDYAVLDGTIVFAGFSVDGGPTLTGTATVPYGYFYFSGDAEFSIADNNFTGDPGYPFWDEVEMTFTNITVSGESESWSLGEGDWYIQEISSGDSMGVNIYSMTVKYAGSTYKLENTYLDVSFSSAAINAPGAIMPLGPVIPDMTTVVIDGTDTATGTFYHPELGKIWFTGTIYEEDPPDEITDGSLTFYNAADAGESLFSVNFIYDAGKPATAYYISGPGAYEEYGYIIDGTFTPDSLAEGAFVT